MPELPEVETIKRGLAATITGRAIAGIEVLVKRCFPTWQGLDERVLIGASAVGLERRGKLLVLHLSSGWSLLAHLRMTGQLIYRANEGKDFGGGYPSDSLIGELPDKTTRVIIDFDNGAKLFFNDQRKFGYLKVVPTELLEEEDFIQRLGPEPLADEFSWQVLKKQLSKGSGNRPVKAALLDQQTIAGIGNIYADESLFAAGILPERPCSSLDEAELKRLHRAIRKCMRQSIADGGSTSRNYVDALGLRGEFLDLHANVYGRAGEPCHKCGKPLSKTRVAGRGTTYCANCQH
jgi:formamidopyrimidine-DNA glycosylase